MRIPNWTWVVISSLLICFSQEAVAASGWCVDGDSIVSRTLSVMDDRSWAKLPANSSLDDLELSYALLYWSDSGGWDPVRRQVRWVGSGGSCCSDSQYKMLTYDVESDVWSVEDAPFKMPGHAYDGNAVDPNTGDHYFALFQTRRVQHREDSNWKELPVDLPWKTQPAVGMCWFPELNDNQGGLVFVNGYGRVARYSDNQWVAISGAESDPWGSYNLFAEYSPKYRIVWMGAGNGADRVSYKLDTDLNLTKLNDAPFSLNNNQALHSVDPVTGVYIVSNLNTDTWWTFDAGADLWEDITATMQDAPSISPGSWFQVPIPDCGGILYFRMYGSDRDVYLYKHASSDAVPNPPTNLIIKSNDR